LELRNSKLLKDERFCQYRSVPQLLNFLPSQLPKFLRKRTSNAIQAFFTSSEIPTKIAQTQTRQRFAPFCPLLGIQSIAMHFGAEMAQIWHKNKRGE